MPERKCLPVSLALVALLLGVYAMASVLGPAVSAFGTRPGLVLAELALVAPGVLGLTVLRYPVLASIGLDRPSSATLGMAILSGAALWGASLGLFEVQSLLIPPSDAFLDAFERLHEALAPAGFLDGLASVVTIAIVPACCEEILFRGVILRSLLASFGPAVAILGAATLFGLIHVMPLGHHLSFYRVPFAFAVGIGLGLLRVRTGSVVPPILAHATLNTITFLAAIPFAGQGLKRGADPLAPAGLPLLIVGTLTFLFLLRRSRTLTLKSGVA
jgi:membrane protease YdiL (CAAX protease family)